MKPIRAQNIDYDIIEHPETGEILLLLPDLSLPEGGCTGVPDHGGIRLNFADDVSLRLAPISEDILEKLRQIDFFILAEADDTGIIRAQEVEIIHAPQNTLPDDAPLQ